MKSKACRVANNDILFCKNIMKRKLHFFELGLQMIHPEYICLEFNKSYVE